MESKEIQQIESEEQTSVFETTKKRVFPSFVDVLMLVALFFVGSLCVGFVVGLMEVPRSALSHLLVYGCSMLLSMLLMVGYCLLRKHKPTIFRYKYHWYTCGLILWGLVAIGAVGIVEEPLFSLMPQEWLESVNQTIGTGVWAICSLVVLAPIFEELIFRGVVLGSLRNRFGAFGAIVMSSLIFGLVHIVPQQAINAALVGMILGGIYVATDSMPAVIVLHAINNGLSYLQYVTRSGGDGSFRGMVSDDASYKQVYIISCAFLIISVLLVILLCRSNRRKEDESDAVAIK